MDVGASPVLTCDASSWVKGYTIFSKGISHCGKPAVALFKGTRKDGHTCDFARCAEHVEETARVLDSNQGGVWSWTRETYS